MSEDLSHFVIPLDTPISKLEARDAFDGLTEREKFYCHFLSRASWEGGVICLLQTSPESVPIFLLLRELFSRQDPGALREAVGDGVSGEEFKAFLLYTAALFSNMGNYKSFGDTKFIPGLEREKLYAILQASELYCRSPELVERLWGACSSAMYSLTPRQRQLGLGQEGITTYFSGNCTTEDAELVKLFMLEKNISPYNTRLFKTVTRDGHVEYDIRLASAATSADPCDPGDKVAGVLGTHPFRGTTVSITRGDYAPIMQRMVQNLQKAKSYAANEHEVAMLEAYATSFQTGSLDAHKEGSRHWIKDKGPVVEMYIGFIETYRDPFGVRGEYEGFVAVVNKAMSAKFSQLVSSAEQLLPELPWPREFEKDRFLRPDFTSLDVVTYASSGIPAGINIPNYDEIRQNEGFKNVSLGNVLSARSDDQRVSFLADDDQELFTKLKAQSFEVQVGLHELLGHGSGKLFQQDENGDFNFSAETVKNPLSGQKITSWYGPGETWDTKFSTVASSYEECRAECVGLYLCTSREILRIFGYDGSAAEDVLYVNWLNMVRAGLVGLEYFTPGSNKWRQAHMQARYVILRVLLENAKGLVSIDCITGSDGKPDIVIKLDRTKIESLGRPAIGDFLMKLQVYKSMADVAGGQSLYDKYSEVSGEWLALRETVLTRKIPRRMYVQPLTVEEGGGVQLREFAASPEGIIQCCVECFPAYDSGLEALWKKDRHFWSS